MRLLWSRRRRREIVRKVCLLTLLAVFASCNSSHHPKPRPERIVSLAPSITEILFAIGCGTKVVGVTTHCNHPAVVKQIARIGQYADPDLERILALHPHLVVGTSIASHKEVLAALSKRGVPILCVPEGGIAELKTAVRRIGRATGNIRQAEELLRRIESAVKEARLSSRGRRRLRVLFLVGHQPFCAAAAGTLPADLLKIAGAVPLPQKAKGYIMVSLERIAAEKPDLVLDASMGSERSRNNQSVKQLARVIPDIERRYFTVNPDLFCRSGPRIVDALKTLLEVLNRWR
ncbi:MAG: hypothetical protein DRP63_02350 [Planctomycetota bacterium]|nr:MAG: hypothetical protein DRP63_02350 [Planctomycetota bacterium]